jgi:excisionase family DNA binding protein
MGLPEASAFLGIAPRTLRKWINRRGVPVARIGQRLRFRRAALVEWLQTQEQATAAARTGSPPAD